MKPMGIVFNGVFHGTRGGFCVALRAFFSRWESTRLLRTAWEQSRQSQQSQQLGQLSCTKGGEL